MKMMRKLLSLILLVGMLGVFTSCDEEEEVVGVVYYPVIVTHTIGNAIDYQTAGLDYMTWTASMLTNESLEDPKEVYTYNASASNTWANGSNNTQYEYTGTTTAEGIDFESTLLVEYETYLMKSDDDVVSQWELKDISADSDYYKLSGTTSRTGMQYSKVYEDSFESTVVLSFEDLEVNRVTGFIKSGVVKFTYEGNSSYDVTYNSTGEIRYSDYKSVLVID